MTGHAPGATAAVLLLYSLLMVGIGIWSRRRLHGFRDYVTGGGAIPPAMLVVSFVANYISTNTFVAQAGQSHRFGLVWLVVPGVIIACAAISWWWIAPRLARFAAREKAVTLPDFFAARFGSPALTQLVQWIVVTATFVYVLSVMRSAGTVLQFALDVPYAQAVALLYLVTVAYCLFGGMWADVTTDCVQGVLMGVGALVLFAALVLSGDRVSAPAAPAIEPISLAVVAAIGLGGGLKMMADPKQLLVFYALRDERAARRFRIAVPLLLILFFGALFPVGFLARGIVGPVADAEHVVPRLLFESPIVSPAVALVILGSMVAAAMSSLDSALLVIASCLERHVVAPRLGGESTRRARALLGSVATLALLLSIRPLAGVIALTTFSGALLGAAFLPSLLAGLGRGVPAGVAWASVVLGASGAVAGAAGRTLVSSPPAWLQDTFVGVFCAVVPIATWRLRERLRLGGAEQPAR